MIASLVLSAAWVAIGIATREWGLVVVGVIAGVCLQIALAKEPV